MAAIKEMDCSGAEVSRENCSAPNQLTVTDENRLGVVVGLHKLIDLFMECADDPKKQKIMGSLRKTFDDTSVQGADPVILHRLEMIVVDCIIENMKKGHYSPPPRNPVHSADPYWVSEETLRIIGEVDREQYEAQEHGHAEEVKSLRGEINHMRDQLEAMKEFVLTAPDFANTQVIKPYDISVMTSEFVAPQKGYMSGSARSQGSWLKVFINDKSVYEGNSGYGANGTCHYGFFFPVKKGDKFIMKNGDYHAAVFHPCIAIPRL